MFVKGEEYIRKDLHRQYGGNEQSGIAYSAHHPVIFIFSGSSGKAYGYQDGWSEDGYYNYTGQGQIGDMQLKLGNKAILNHGRDKKRVFLFESHAKARCRFVNELELVDYDWFETPDSTGKASYQV